MIDLTTLLDKLNPDPGGESTVRIRVGTVTTVNANGTLDITMSSGVLVPGVPKLANAVAPAGAVVQMISQRGSLLVIGAVAGSSGGAAAGRAGTNIRVTDTGAVTNTETLADTVTAYLVNGATYKVRWTPAVTSTVAGDSLFMRIRDTNLVGAQLQIIRAYVGATGGSGSRWPADIEVEFTATATGNKTFAGTYVRAGGTGNVNIHSTSTSPTYFYVDYVRG